MSGRPLHSRRSVIVTPPSSPVLTEKAVPILKPYVAKYDNMKMANVASPVKREQIRRRGQAELKKTMRESLPIYTMEEIRRYRMPLHEAIAIELEDQHLISSVTFLKQLIDYQKWMRESNGPESKIWAKPQIIETTEVLLNLSEAFKKAELAHYTCDFAVEIDQFIHLCVKYAFGCDDWWWLGEQLLMQCSELAKRFEGDGHRRYAISEYIYGKFLFENMQDREQTSSHLRHARTLSMGHSWTAAKYLNCVQKTVFVESCILLYKVLLEDAKEMMKYDAKEAIKLCIKAKRRAYDACVHDGEAKALLLEGNCHMLIDQVNEAAQCFYKVLLMQTKAKKIEETCKARIWLIRAYLKLGHWEESYNHLQKLLQFALENNLPYYVGQAYRYLGEYYLNHGNPNLATPLLLKAIEAFHEIGDVDNREQVKNFAAVSAGQELMPKYIRCIVNAGGKSPQSWRYLERLLAWKDLRKNIWAESSVTLIKKSSDESLESGTELGTYMFGEEEIIYEEDILELTTTTQTYKTESTNTFSALSVVSSKPFTDSISSMRKSHSTIRSKTKSVTIKPGHDIQET